MTKTIRLTMAQALLRFLSQQFVSSSAGETAFVHGVFGIFGHGNVTGLGEALEFDTSGLTYYQGHNEQGMAHAAIAFAKQKRRLAIIPCTSSIGPGATNMVTAAATATINRIPLLLLPGDVFACRQPDPVLQQLEQPFDGTISVNDCFKPVSRYWDRVTKPEQLIPACLNAMRVLTDPAETGAVTLCLPQDIQSQAYDYPETFFHKRVWYIDHPAVPQRAIEQAATLLKQAKNPLIIAGGGVHYAFATEELANFSRKHGIPVTETQAGKSALTWSHPFNLGGIGVTGTEAANQLAVEADVILAIGTRLQDFTTASKWLYQHPHRRIIQLNINSQDVGKMDALALKGDAKTGLQQLSLALESFTTSSVYQEKISGLKNNWQAKLTQLYQTSHKDGKGFHQVRTLGILNEIVAENDTIICAAGSLPGDLHRLWCCKSNHDYHMEYGYSCMGYEVAAGFGVRMAKGDSGEVYVLVGDGSYLMLHSELLTSLQENKKITVILFDNHGYQCIRNLQEAHGSQGFGNEFRYRNPQTNKLDGNYLAIDFAQYASALGAKTYSPLTENDFKTVLLSAKQEKNSCVIVMPVLPKTMSSGYAWWRVGVAETSRSKEVNAAYETMQREVEKATFN